MRDVVRCYLLGALCGLFREVVVGVVSLSDATEQHGHDACRTTHARMQTLSLNAMTAGWTQAVRFGYKIDNSPV